MQNNLINYVDENNNIIMKHPVNSFLVKSENDLAILTDAKCSVGTQAYLADESKVWELGIDYEWKLISGASSESSEQVSSSNRFLVLEMYYDSSIDVDYLDLTAREIINAYENNNIVFLINKSSPAIIEYRPLLDIHTVRPDDNILYSFEFSNFTFLGTIDEHPSMPD